VFLVDTNVVSELRKLERADRKVWSWATTIPPLQSFLSVMSLQEIELGILRIERKDPSQATQIRRWFIQSLLPSFAGRILPIDEAVALKTASLHVPDPRPERDALIAATALVHGLTVATRNVRDFAPMGVRLINPWE
jgi:predicted nucleic acid-binding protein